VAITNLGAASVLIVEVTTMRNGIRDVQASYTNVYIEGNNKILL